MLIEMNNQDQMFLSFLILSPVIHHHERSVIFSQTISFAAALV